MNWSIAFVIKSILLGIGLAMDAFSVSLANGLNESNMKKRRMVLIAGTFAIFQALMPMIGWTCVHTVASYLKTFEKMIPWISLLLLVYIGSGMILNRDEGESDENNSSTLSFKLLMIQGVATSIDALSIGFTIADYNLLKAIICAAIIAGITFIICFSGIIIGKKFGTKLSGKASILGGVILIAIGIEIFISGILK